VSSPPSPIMVFGKVPTQGDFVRVNIGRGAGGEVEAWLSRCVEQAHGRIPDSSVRLIARLGPELRLIAGAWIPSRDAVGRAFPFAFFRDVDDELSLAPASVLPGFLAPWYEGIETAARSAVESGASDAASRAAAVDLGHPSAVPGAAHRAAEALRSLMVSELAGQLYAEANALDQLAYGLTCVRKAVQRSQSAGIKGIVLDAPCQSGVHVFVWLEVLRRTLGSASLPWCVLVQDSSRRLLISLGGLAEMILAFLVTPEHPSPERWPLWSSRPDATARAREGLPSPVADVFVRNGTVDSLLEALQG
jgi:type VI secretion system ImpM family protein